jgi:hypothetical protein
MSDGCAIIPLSKRAGETAARTDLGFDSRFREACLFAKMRLGLEIPTKMDNPAHWQKM